MGVKKRGGGVERHFDEIAKDYDYYKNKNDYYYINLKRLIATFIPKNEKVLEVGCGTGDILASLSPNPGYGVDLSSEMVKIATKKHRDLNFSTNYPNEKFNYIFMCDVIEHLEDPQEEFNKISSLLNGDGYFVNTMANPIWEPLLLIWEKMGWKMPEGPHNRIKYEDLRYIIEKSGMRIVKHDFKLLFPVKVPVITELVNKFIEPILKRCAFIEFVVCKKT